MIHYRYPFTLGVVLMIRHGDEAGLEAVIEGLRNQSLSKRHWRLTVADERARANEALAEKLAWHPCVSIVRDESFHGPATLEVRAMLAQRSDLVVYLDGRTILQRDFLETALRLAEKHRFVGMFGGHAEIAGDCPAPTWHTPFLRLFGVRTVREENILQQSDRRFMPGPSGFVIRREHLRRFGHILRRHPFFEESEFIRRRNDFDFRSALARTVIQSGFSMGLFPALRLERFMHRRDYAERAVRAAIRRDAFSRVLERFVWTGMLPETAHPSRFESFALQWMHAWHLGRRSRLE